jgi:hypothetical protein
LTCPWYLIVPMFTPSSGRLWLQLSLWPWWEAWFCLTKEYPKRDHWCLNKDRVTYNKIMALIVYCLRFVLLLQ